MSLRTTSADVAGKVRSADRGQRRSRIEYVHNFRGLAIMFIVATHCLSVFDWSGSPALEDFLERVVANGTVFFLFIGGFLFQHLSGDYRPLPYLWKKFKYVVVPYLITSVPALVAFTWLVEREGMPAGFYEQAAYLRIAEFIVTGAHLAPFWFIPTIIVFYLLSPAIHLIFRRAESYLLLPLLLLVPLFVSRGSGNPIQSFLHFLPVWVVGMACARFGVRATDFIRSHVVWLFLGVLALFALELVLAVGTHSAYSDFGKVGLTLCLFEMMRRLGGGVDKIFGMAGTLSFGVYFLHSYLITAGKIIYSEVFGGSPPGGLFLLVVVSGFAICASLFLVASLKRLIGPSISRMVIGV